MESLTKQSVASAESVANTGEKERKVPLGYDTIPHEMWLLQFDRTHSHHWTLEDLPEYKNNHWYARLGQVVPESNIVRDRRGGENYSFFFKPFEKMRVAMSKILTETDFASRIEKGEYAIILGEDTSGRLPTLFLKELVKGLETENKNLPTTKFYAGHRSGVHKEQGGEYKKKLVAYLENLKREYLSGENAGKKILICTEAISTGGTVAMTLETIRELGCGADVLTFAGGKKYTPPPGVTVFSGIPNDSDAFDNSIEKNYMMSGVGKKDGDIHATSVKLMDQKSKEKALNDTNANNLREDVENIQMKDAMKASRFMAGYVAANVAQAYLDYRAGEFELFKWPQEAI